MTTHLTIADDPVLRYLLRIGDTCLIHAQRLSEWCGHAPILEEDIALTNFALDLIGQARAILSHAGRRLGTGCSEDDLAFLRRERDYLNPTLVELPRGDFAFTSLRNLMVAALLTPLWRSLEDSTDAELAAIAGKAFKESCYHLRHSADWCVRLGRGTAESRRRMEEALVSLWPYAAELFETSADDLAARAGGLGPDWSTLQAPWSEAMDGVLGEAGLAAPASGKFRSHGRAGRHSEHMGYLLAEMQFLQRAYPGGQW